MSENQVNRMLQTLYDVFQYKSQHLLNRRLYYYYYYYQ